jgi:hypothetical protein
MSEGARWDADGLHELVARTGAGCLVFSGKRVAACEAPQSGGHLGAGCGRLVDGDPGDGLAFGAQLDPALRVGTVCGEPPFGQGEVAVGHRRVASGRSILHDGADRFDAHHEGDRTRMSDGVAFDTTISAFGNNTGIEVPESIIEQLGAGRRPAVLVNVNGYEYRNTVGVMGGKHLISVSAAVRKATGLQGGDAVHVVLTVADTPRAVDMPDDFATALAADAVAGAFFAKLSNSLQRYHADNVNAAKIPETRQRRIDKAIALFH